MKSLYKPCIIFSVDKANNTKMQNHLNQRHAENDLTRMGIIFERLLGMYEGNEERSYMVTDLSPDNVKMILGLAKTYDQESILLRDNENSCTLKYFDGRPMLSIGKLNATTVENAWNNGNWTYSPKLNQYFVCE